MIVKEAMTEVVLTVGPTHTIGDVARQMYDRGVGAAIVTDPDLPAPGIITERDCLKALASAPDPIGVYARDYMSGDLIYGDPEWSLEQAAATMVEHSFRHLIVVERGKVAGVISMRDIVNAWVRSGALT